METAECLAFQLARLFAEHVVTKPMVSICRFRVPLGNWAAMPEWR